jgi:hypothetical protein
VPAAVEILLAASPGELDATPERRALRDGHPAAGAQARPPRPAPPWSIT